MIGFTRSTLFWFGFVLSTVVLATLGLCTAPFPYVVRFRVINSWTCFNLWWLKITCDIRYEVEGWDNLPTGSAIIFAKHQSTWETLAIPCLFPMQVQVLKRELLKIPFFGWALALVEPIAIDRKAGRNALKQLIEQGNDRLSKGLWVLVFPEGTRVAPGQQGQYHKGGAVLAAKTGYPVVPIAHNAGNFWPRRGFIKHPGKVVLSIGPVIETKHRRAEEIMSEAQSWIEAKVAELQSQTVSVNNK